MARPPMPVGTHGKITTRKVGKSFVARTLFRDYDGETREVTKTGSTGPAAERALKEALRDRARLVGGGDLHRDDPIEKAIEYWLTEIKADDESMDNLVFSSDHSLGTRDRYRRVARGPVKKGVGQLRIRELTVGRAQSFLTAVEREHGAATAKLARTVLSNIAGCCARHDALERNPVKDVAAISVVSEEKAALDSAQVRDLRMKVRADARAVRRDLPDVVDMFFGTALRIGEVSAIRALDLYWWTHPDEPIEQAARIEINANMVRIKGALVRQEKRDANNKLKPRVIGVPTWLVHVLTARIDRMVEAGTFDEEGPLFPAPKGGWRDPSNTQADLRQAFDDAGYPEVSSHTGRRSVVTKGDRSGLQTSAMAAHVGHDRQETTHRYQSKRYLDTGVAAVLEDFATEGELAS